MWVFTPRGFFSVTAISGSTVQVRARRQADLYALASYGLAVGKPTSRFKVIETSHRDYPFRIIMPKEEWAAILAKMGDAIDYSNFKDTVHKVDANRASIYSRVWAVLMALEDADPVLKQYRSKWSDETYIPPIEWAARDADGLDDPEFERFAENGKEGWRPIPRSDLMNDSRFKPQPGLPKGRRKRSRGRRKAGQRTFFGTDVAQAMAEDYREGTVY